MKLSILILFLFHPGPSMAIDLKFRFEQGYCQKSTKVGFNPEFFGECGNLTKSRIIKQEHEEPHLLGAVFNSVYIYVSRFHKGNLNNTSFMRSTIMQTQFEDNKAKNMNLSGSYLKGVSFAESDLQNLLANGTRFMKVSFQNCDLRRADFWGSFLFRSDFSGADLRGANLENTSLLLSHFTKAQFNHKTKLPFSKEEAIKKGMVFVD